MAPNVTDIQQQTFQIISCLFEEQRTCFRGGDLEVDGPEHQDTFDPIKIAGKLRELGDDYEEKVIKPLMNNLKYVPAHQAAAAFGEGVTFLCQSHVAQRPGVAPEMQLIQASVAFGLYVRKASPDLREKVQDAMVAFLNSRVGSWVAQQGGWDVVTGV